MEIRSQTGNQGNGLAKYLSQLDVWAVALGCIVGWGAFVMPGTTFIPVAGPGGTLIAMTGSVIIMMIIGASYSYLMEHRPGTGGVYAYTKEAFGRDHAFLCSWFLSLSYISIVFLNATALLVVCRTLFGSLLQIGFHYQIAGYDIYFGEVLLSMAALVIFGLLLILGKPVLQQIQTILALILMAGTMVISAACLPHLDPGVLFEVADSGFTAHPSAGIMTIILLSPWAFVGFDVTSLETAHFRFPVRHSKWIIPISILCGGFAYTVLALTSVSAFPEEYGTWQNYFANLDDFSGTQSVPVFNAAYSAMGSAGIVITSITALAAILTGILAAYRATTRVLSTMAEDNILSRRFSSTSFCIIFIMCISIVVSFLGRNALNWFVELTTFGAIVGFGYTCASAYVLARRENDQTAQGLSIAGLVIAAAFAAVELLPKITLLETMGAQSFLMLACWCLLGFIFYWKTMTQSTLEEYNGNPVSSTVLFSLLLYSMSMWFILRLLNTAAGKGLGSVIVQNSVIFFLLVFAGLIIMIYVQNLLRKRQEELERKMIHAEESSRAKSQFLFNMSHDIRTPMNAILGYARLMEKEDMSPSAEEYLGKISASGNHLLTLLNDILEMGQIESGKLELRGEPGYLREAVQSAFDLYREQMEEKHIRFSLSLPGTPKRPVLFDRSRFMRVVLNLISNAQKFTPADGSVSVSLSETPADDPGKAGFELRVKDSGIGMTPEFVDVLFDAFARERTSTVSGIHGTGLGMAITKSIVDAMGGSIQVDTAPDQGTEFILSLQFPLCDAPAAEAGEAKAGDAKAEDSPDTPDFSGRRLLLADDIEINRQIAARFLTHLGFDVDMAADGEEAVSILRGADPGAYDAVLMDIQMPVMDGYEATRAIRALPDRKKAAIPIIAVTANAFEDDIRRAEEAGMNGHVSKPIDPQQLSDTLRQILS